MSRRSGLTGAGWTALIGGTALLPAGLASGYPTLTGLSLAAGAALVLAVLVTLARPRVTVRRFLTNDRVTVGEPARVRLEVENLSRLPAPGFDAIEQVDGAPLRVPVPGLAPREHRRVQLPVATPRRGLVRLGPVVAEHRDPLGLVRRVQPLSDQAWLWVRPPVHPARALPLGVVLDFEGRLTEQAPAGSTAFASLREYQPGDDPRHIHWRSTARIGTLVVREHVDTTEPTTAIVLDTRAGVLAPAAFEEAVEVAASVATACRRLGRPVTLDAPGEDRYAVEQAGGYDVMDRLAALTQREPAGVSVLTRLAETARPGGSLVVISGAEPGLVARLAPARRRFARVVVVLLQADEPAGVATAAAAGVPATVTRRPGLAVVRARSASDAVQAWSRLVVGGV
jgi:uncharacterized protein (DUF58 family)